MKESLKRHRAWLFQLVTRIVIMIARIAAVKAIKRSFDIISFLSQFLTNKIRKLLFLDLWFWCIRNRLHHIDHIIGKIMNRFYSLFIVVDIITCIAMNIIPVGRWCNRHT